MAVSQTINAVVDEAVGRSHRDDPVLPATGGPAGNARLTAWTGLLLLALILVELFTVLDVRGMLSWHVVVGTLLVPVALVKTGSTSWRFVRYYKGNRPYRKAGPPPTLLRILGPLVIASTFGLLGTGLALIWLGPTSGRRPLVTVLGQQLDVLTMHQGLFIVFSVVVGLHLIARLVPAVSLVLGRSRRGAGQRAVPGGRRRMSVLVVALVVAAAGATIVLAASTAWQHDRGHDHGGPPGSFGQQR